MTANAYRMIGLGLAGIVFLFDQAMKFLVMGPLALPQRGAIELLPIFALRYTENHGISLGLLTADSNASRWLLVALTAAIATGVVVWLLREKLLGEIVALALVLGGALGNIVDRSRLGFVIDYADLHFGDFRPFLIFNIADAAITIGVLLLLARSLLMRDKRADSGAATSNDAPATEIP